MTDYERIKVSCLKRGELWEDPDFPATQASVFYHQTPPFQFLWKRPKELFNRPTFVQDGSADFDVVTGKMGDKWLVSCVGVLYLSKGLFYRVVPADQRFEDPYAGVFRFRLWWCGQWVEVLVDDRLPTVNGKLAFLQTSRTDQLWPALLEKAYAKLHGSYEALKYGSLLDGLADLTGGITESIPITQYSANNVRLLTELLKTTSLVTCTIQNTNSRTQTELLNGIQYGLNYRIYGLEKVVKLCHPLGIGNIELLGYNSPKWDSIPPHEKDRLGLKRMNIGEFWIWYSDFEEMFTHVETVHLDSETSRDEPSLQAKNTWQMKVYQGTWRKGVSAGGCRNNIDTFHINPQIHITLLEQDGIVISLNQHSIMEPNVIGFSAYTLSKSCTETIQRPFFRKNKSLVNSQYTNSRQVSHRCQLEAGGYLIMPTTFETGDESNFTLRIFSSKQIKLKVLDTSPQVFKAALIKAPPQVDAKSFMQYEAVFLQLADEHRTVNAFELQELLDACLPNDYIKSCASMEVCRQVVLTLDTTGTGRLTLSDFKDLMCSLKHWQTIFKTHTREKMGVLRAEKLRDALKDIGFRLPEKALSLLNMRYMRKDGTLRFGDFVSAVLHLQVAFSVFDGKDTQKSGSVKMNLSDVLQIFFIAIIIIER